VLGRFEDHDGFDGVMLGAAGGRYHFEFTRHRQHPVAPAPTMEDLVVFYLPDATEWHMACARMAAARFRQVASFNTQLERRGRTYEERDGYSVVLQNAEWREGWDVSCAFVCGTTSRIPVATSAAPTTRDGPTASPKVRAETRMPTGGVARSAMDKVLALK